MTDEISAPAGADITALELPSNAPDALGTDAASLLMRNPRTVSRLSIW
jgi:hypothetical protein